MNRDDVFNLLSLSREELKPIYTNYNVKDLTVNPRICLLVKCIVPEIHFIMFKLQVGQLQLTMEQCLPEE